MYQVKFTSAYKKSYPDWLLIYLIENDILTLTLKTKKIISGH